jgi:Zn-dependent protease
MGAAGERSVSWRPRPSGDFFLGGPPRETHGVSTSRTELLHLTIAAVVLTVDIALVRSQVSVSGVPGGLTFSSFLSSLGVAAIAALTGFVAHEMAHKVVAQRHGFWAEFRMSPAGLFFSVATALFGILLALPGATMIGGMGDVREWGRTSVAGPAVNLSEGAVFLAVSFVTVPIWHSPILWVSLIFLALVNGIFAAFNLLPIGPLDGRKVLRWNRGVWIASFGLSLVFVGAVLSVLYLAPPVF